MAFKTNIRSTVRGIVREEFKKQLQKEAEEGSGVPKRFSKVWDTLPKAKWAAFGSWLRGVPAGKSEPRFKNSIPSSVSDAEVVDYIDKNPASVRLSPAQLVDMFKNIPSIQKGLGNIGHEDIEKLDKAVNHRDTDATLAQTGKDIGITGAGAAKIADKAQDAYKKFYDDMSPDDLSGDEFDALFGKGGKFDAAVEQAADIYARILAASKGNIDKVFDALKPVSSGKALPGLDGVTAKYAAGTLQKDEPEMLSNSERVAVQHLADLAAEGKIDTVKALLKRDIDRPMDDSNVIKSFQNLVSKLIRKDMDAVAIQSGEKRGRGRPKGSLNKKR